MVIKVRYVTDNQVVAVEVNRVALVHQAAYVIVMIDQKVKH